MGLSLWLNLEPQDAIAYLVSAVLGYFAGTLFGDFTAQIFVSILVSYHLFLGWLVLTAEERSGISLPIVSTLLTHLACMAVVITFGMGRNVIPFFGVLRYGIASLAIFERGWLFRAAPVATSSEDDLPRPSSVSHLATPDDYEEWLKHLATRKIDPRHLRVPLSEQYERFVLERVRQREVQAMKVQTLKQQS